MSGPATCPFCNALLNTTPEDGPGRVVCPRCGEAVGPATQAPPTGRGRPETAVEVSRVRSRRFAWIAVLGLVAVVGGWALWAKWHHIRTPFGGPTPAAQPVVVKPADLPGLGYLPASTDAVLAVQVPLLLERLGPEAQQEP